jgi:hypothetical protein
MDLGTTPLTPCSAEELAALLRQQLAAPISVDLEGLDARHAAALKGLSDAQGLLLKSFDDLFQHPHPPLELLELVKEFAKTHRKHPHSTLPNEIATLLYYASLASALARRNKRISRLNEEELRRAFDWVFGQPWVDERTKNLMAEAVRCLGGKI